MKLQVRIAESVIPQNDKVPQSVIVEFLDDKEKQTFEILFYNLNPYQIGLRKWEVWEFNVKWKSEIFTDEKSGVKSYFTHLICDKVFPIHQLGRK